MATLSVAWVLANSAITSVILGASRLDQLIDTLAVADYYSPHHGEVAVGRNEY
jgi:1-deoxyxylulose-5-phosphate synthase